MGKGSRKERSKKFYQDILNDENIFGASPGAAASAGGGSISEMSFIKLYLIQLFAFILFTLPWVSDCGNKGKEIKRD